MSYDQTFLLLAIACTMNAIGDVFLLRGVCKTNWEPGIEALRQTSDRNLIWGALSGLATITPWSLLLPLLANIPGVSGRVALLSYATYVAVTLAFHVSYGFIGLAVKADHTLSDQFQPLVTVIAGTSFGLGVLFSIAWSAAILQAEASWRYVFVTPAITIAVCQFLLGYLFRRVPYYLVVSGPLAMLVFFWAFLQYAETVQL